MYPISNRNHFLFNKGPIPVKPHFPKALLSASIASTLFASSALAQSGPVFEEVIVTAEKRSESLQDLSQAVTALTAADVEDRQLTSFVDLSAIAPLSLIHI